MTEYNEWFDEVTEEEYNIFVEGLKLVKPNHVQRRVYGNGARECRLNDILVAFTVHNSDNTITYCISNEDIVC